MITDKLIDCVRYHETDTKVTWETCTLRKWMNNDFIRTAFSSEEQAQIATVTNLNPDNLQYTTKGGNPTSDKVFALSITETRKYFHNDNDRMAALSEYVKINDAWTDNTIPINCHIKTDFWWLRSPGSSNEYAVRILNDGNIDRGGFYVNCLFAVRPAFWLNL